jgi:hypothetical protein
MNDQKNLLPAIIALAFACACGSTDPVEPSEDRAPSAGHAPAETRASFDGKAAKSSPATAARMNDRRPYGGNDFGPRPGDRPAQQLPRTRTLPAAEHATLLRDETASGRRLAEPAPETGAPAPRPAENRSELLRKHEAFLTEWNQLKPTIAHLPPEEQEARRAALKRSVILGD